MSDQSFSTRKLLAVLIFTLAAPSCGSGAVPAEEATSSEVSNEESSDDVAGEPASDQQDGERTIVMTIDNGDVWEFTGECKLQEVNSAGVVDSFTIDGSHPDGHELVFARGGFDADSPYISGSVRFAESSDGFGGFSVDVDDSLEATVDGDSLQASVDFRNPRGTAGDGYGEGFSATLSC